MTRLPLRRALWMAALTLLAGCSALTKAAVPLDAYTLTPLVFEARAQTSARHLVVELPTASGALATDRILILPNPLQAEYLPLARWVDPAPVLVQNLLVASLQGTEAFRRVGRDGAGLTPDFVLLVELAAFQAEAPVPGVSATQVRVGLTATLVREEDGRLIAARRFDHTAMAPSAATLDLVTAFDVATRVMLTGVVDWTLDQSRQAFGP